MNAKNTINDLRKKDDNLVNGAGKAKDPGKLPENTPNVEKLRVDEPDPKTKAPEEEAQSHKPTYGAASERPGVEQEEPEKDESTKADKVDTPETPNPAAQVSDSAEDVTTPGARPMAEAHEENKAQVKSLADSGGAEVAETEPPVNDEALADAQTTENQGFDAGSPDPTKPGVSEEMVDELESLRDGQDIQNNPDAFQRAIHQSTTEDVLSGPSSRPKTIDPMTGQVHYIGDEATLGSQASSEGKGE